MPRTKLNIKLLGREAHHFTDLFPDENVSCLQTHQEIKEDDDFVFCLSYARIIPGKYLSKPRVGIFVNHSSDLPKGRGWAPLQWSVLKKMRMITITIIKASEGIDEGKWCFKQQYPIEPFDTIYELYEKDRNETKAILRRLVSVYKAGTLEFYDQEGEPEYWPRRYPKDSVLNPDLPLSELWDHIRICDNDLYPAFFFRRAKKIFVHHLPEYNLPNSEKNEKERPERELDTQISLSDLWDNVIEKRLDLEIFYLYISNRKKTLNFKVANNDPT